MKHWNLTHNSHNTPPTFWESSHGTPKPTCEKIPMCSRNVNSAAACARSFKCRHSCPTHTILFSYPCAQHPTTAISLLPVLGNRISSAASPTSNRMNVIAVSLLLQGEDFVCFETCHWFQSLLLSHLLGCCVTWRKAAGIPGKKGIHWRDFVQHRERREQQTRRQHFIVYILLERTTEQCVCLFLGRTISQLFSNGRQDGWGSWVGLRVM